MLEWVGLEPSSYSIAIYLFIRLLGVIYLTAYIPLLRQIRGIVGSHGITPVTSYLANMKKQYGRCCYYYAPTLFWMNSSDKALLTLLWAGIFCGALLALGVYPLAVLICLAIIHLSLITAGQEFMVHAPDVLLLQLTVGTILLIATSPFNSIAWVGLNFLLLRFHFQAGIAKLLTKDKNYRNLTGLSYHYLTQPMPNTIAWYVHKWPMWFHKVGLVAMFYLELIVPFAIFATPEIRLFVFIQLVGLQVMIWATGNFSYLNHLTVVACTILLHNAYLEPFLGSASHFSISSPFQLPSSFGWELSISLLSAAFLLCELISFFQPFVFKKTCLRSLELLLPLKLGKPYWLFASLSVRRYEIIIEGSDDGRTWHEYLFYYKPGDVAKRPKRFSPHMPRLDGLMWFLTFAEIKQEQWFQQFLLRLLQGSVPVSKLLQYNPFAAKPPRFIRATVYLYTFTSLEEKARTGNWWKRQRISRYVPPVSLSAGYDLLQK